MMRALVGNNLITVYLIGGLAASVTSDDGSRGFELCTTWYEWLLLLVVLFWRAMAGSMGVDIDELTRNGDACVSRTGCFK
jgi:hypothetical protein